MSDISNGAPVGGASDDELGEKLILLRERIVRYMERRGCPSGEDIAQEAVFRLWQKRIRGESIDDDMALGIGISKLVFLEWCRRTKRDPEALEETGDPPATPSEELNQAEECVRECLPKLPGGRGQLLEAYIVEGFSADELASKRGVQATTVRTQVFRALRALETCVCRCLSRGQQRRNKFDFLKHLYARKRA